MKLNLSKSQFAKIRNGHNVQLKHEQLGYGMSFDNIHPLMAKKIMSAYRNGKGIRVYSGDLDCSGDCDDDNDDYDNDDYAMNGGRISLNRTLKKIGIKKDVNKAVKYARPILRETNNILDKAGLGSIQGMLVDEAVNYLPIPATAKSIISAQITRQVDKQIEGRGIVKTLNRGLKKIGIKKDVYNIAKHVTKQNVVRGLNYANQFANDAGYDNLEDQFLSRVSQNERLNGAISDRIKDQGINRRVLEGGSINPYLPTNMLRRGSGINNYGGSIVPSYSKVQIYDDMKNTLRKDQAGFKANNTPLDFSYKMPKNVKYGKGFQSY